MFPAFPGRPRCPTEKPWVRPTGGLAGVNRREGRAGAAGHGVKLTWLVWYREASLFTCLFHDCLP